ncbi:ketoacyl-synt-domain-containing protein [Ustulina deusta]|nr:ketoacyl-synt-domain-containing protein [Ustulina deusta]
MAEQYKMYLFGDQTYDVQPHLKNLMRSRDNPLLEDFLVKAYESIRREIYKLPAEARDSFPQFSSVDDLILWKRDGKRCVALDMAVTCMYQLGTFISQHVSSTQVSKPHVLGICTGALSAAAVDCSQNVMELVANSVCAVRVAFRTGLRVTEMALRIESSTSKGDKEWSIIIPGLASAEAVLRHCETMTLPSTTKPYISACAPSGITISGPPHSIDQLKSLGGADMSGAKSIPVYAPYHAPHLYSPDDVDEVVGTLGHGGIPLNGACGPKDDSFEVSLKAAVQMILLRPIDWSEILEDLKIHLQKKQPKSFHIIPIGTKADQLIYTALKQTSLSTLLPPRQPGSQPPQHGTVTVDPCYSPGKPKLAIIGMSGRFPGAQDNEAFWDVLYQGLDMHKGVPALHWDTKTHVDPTGKRKNTSVTPFGCWLDDPASFDARFFNISPREAPQIDPAQRIALMTAYEAIEQAGIVPDATPSTRRDRVGVFYGVTSQDWFETNSAQNIDTYFIPGGNMAFIPGRINYFFKFSGPSFAINTACSSSLAAIHLACNSLWRGEVDTAIAGGTNILTNPDMTAGLDKGHFLSQTGNCKTFDDSADGYCRGEGVGTVILKRLDDALADKDPILGVILGAYTNHSAESESITRPHVGAQRAVFNKILNQSSIDPYSVGYVEMHGTGTQAGDAGEMSSVLDTFAPSPDKTRNRGRSSDQALFLGSAKANIGHGEAASGMASLLKVLLMMQKNLIVPHCGIKTRINHKFPTDLAKRNVHIALKPTSWARNADPAKPRRAFVNNFSAAGGNTAILLEDAPLVSEPVIGLPDSRTHHVVAVSAKNSISLQGNLRSLHHFLKHTPDVPLAQLSYTTTARRIHHQHRVMLTGTRVEDLCAQIDAALRDQIGTTRPKSSPKIVFTFTGQGAQYPGMGKELYGTFSLYRNELNRLDRICQKLGFPSFLPIINANPKDQDLSLFSPIIVQLSSICMQIALAKLWRSWGVLPAAVLGHSLGEYAALNVAGVLSDASTIYLVGMRAKLLQEKCTKDTHSMLVAKASVAEISSALAVENNLTYEVACTNSPTETVLAGIRDDVSVLKNALTEAGIKTTLLRVPYAFHSSQVEPILKDFKEIAANVAYSEAKIPVICSLDGNIVNGTGVDSFGPDYLARHTREPVNMLQALLAAKSDHIILDKSITLEIGPHPAVSGMVKATLGSQVNCLPSLQRDRPIFQLLVAALKALYVSGVDIRWPAYHNDFESSHKVISMPAYHWDLKPYWIQYVHDWSLRKGDPVRTIAAGHTRELESTTIHRVVEESGDLKKASIVIESDMARTDFRPLVEGHEVDGVSLCTPAVYADIALSLGTHLLERYHPNKTANPHLEIADMAILKALSLRADESTQQILQVHAEADWLSNSAAIKFMTFDARKKLQQHSRCVIQFKGATPEKKIPEALLQKIKVLREGIATGNTARFNRAMVYRAIRPLAIFHEEYRAVDEIVLDSKTLEATSRLSFKEFKKNGNFHTHPGLIDGLTWAAGFSMNCNDNNDLDKSVFVNHGWQSFQAFEPISVDNEYTTYSHMVEGKDRLWQGDVFILCGEKIVARFGDFAMQGVPRRVLRAILSVEGDKKYKKPRGRSIRKVSAPASQAIGTPPKTHSQVKENVLLSPHIAQAIAIIAEESGIAESDLTDGTVFGDVGIDSLLGLTISARFKEELDLDLDFNAFFYEYPTIGDLKAFLADDSTSSGPAEAPSSGSSDTGDLGPATPFTEYEPVIGSNIDLEKALDIISEESGIAPEELTDNSNFADCGVDSLLSLVIVARFRDELKMDIPHESLFLECPTVGDLKQLFGGHTEEPVQDESATEISNMDESALTESNAVALSTRKKAIDEYVERHTAGFSKPITQPLDSRPYDNTAKVVLVTGATGSLGGHLAFKLAHRPDVQTIICLNREHRIEGFARQEKAMKDKGVHFPDSLLSKLIVLQSDTSKAMLGLSGAEYEKLTSSVTHICHQAWPMSVKRPLAGFEPQFAVMRNLIDLASAIAAKRAEGFRVGFQLVSSISVVGNYNGSRVPEDRVNIDALLPVGYAEAKWGCERMLDETLHKYPQHFRAMTVRLGQIAGSKVSGYWNPMEHFGFLIKSSQTLNALPDVDGTAYWTPVNDIAGTLADLNLADHRSPCYPFYHIENPVGQPWKELNVILADALKIPRQNLIPLEEWTQRVRVAPQRNNPASALVDFLDTNYLRMSCGGLVLDPKNAIEHSSTLAAVGPLSEEVVRRYIYVWKEIGFLD